jgi:DNA polymerase/3'-5' exonuclease PolX
LKLEEAQVLAEKVCSVLQPFCDKIEVAGSVRRGKSEVGDVDIVALPKAVDLPGGLCGVVKVDPCTVWKNLFPNALVKFGLKLEASGQELLRLSFPLSGLQVDVYRARPETWGVILLIRTGSKEHNVKLCTLARSKGWMLSAKDGVIQTLTSGCMTASKVIASQSEEDIFSALGLAFVEPKDREVSW